MLNSRAEGSLFTNKAISLHNAKKKTSKELDKKALKKKALDPSSPEEQLKLEKRKFSINSRKKSNSWISNNLEEIKKEHKSLVVPEIYTDNPLYSELWKLGHKDSSIKSLMRCGVHSHYIIKKLGYDNHLHPVYHRCNNRTCPTCSEIRKKRLLSKYLPFMKSFKRTAKSDFHFLTISPRNYDSLEEGYLEITSNFKKFIRRKYFRERFKWGIWVLEFKENWIGKPQYSRETGEFLYYHDKPGWNIHIHFLYYGSRLDVQIRGNCLECGQNALKYDKTREVYVCKNKKCNSPNVIVKHRDSRLVREWKDSSNNQDVYIYISPDKKNQNKNLQKNLNYILKYISIDKNDFYDYKSQAKFIHFIHNKRLFNKFGNLEGIEHKPISEFGKNFYITKEGFRVSYSHNVELVNKLLKENEPSKFFDSDKDKGDNLDIGYVKI